MIGLNQTVFNSSLVTLDQKIFTFAIFRCFIKGELIKKREVFSAVSFTEFLHL